MQNVCVLICKSVNIRVEKYYTLLFVVVDVCLGWLLEAIVNIEIKEKERKGKGKREREREREMERI